MLDSMILTTAPKRLKLLESRIFELMIGRWDAGARILLRFDQSRVNALTNSREQKTI